MKHSLNTFLTLLFVCASAWGENVPWQNPQINEIFVNLPMPISFLIRMRPMH